MARRTVWGRDHGSSNLPSSTNPNGGVNHRSGADLVKGWKERHFRNRTGESIPGRDGESRYNNTHPASRRSSTRWFWIVCSVKDGW